MRKTGLKKVPQLRCQGCGELSPAYDMLNSISPEHKSRQLCHRCYNAEVAKLDGLDKFEHVRFEPVRLVDCTDKVHEFHFSIRLFGPGVSLNAFEVRDGIPAGYQFQIIGNPEDDLMVLLGRLIEKMRRSLSVKHIRKGELGLEIADRVVRGRVDWDKDESGSVPLVSIDGRSISWQEFGRMMMTFEGWQFKLEIRDPSEEV